MAFLPAFCAAICAAQGVDLRLPLKFCMPAEDHAMAFPCESVIVIMVLLKLALTCAMPAEMFLFSLCFFKEGLAILYTFYMLSMYVYFFFPAMGRAGPLRVRAFVCVRWPLVGRLFRWRSPR